MLKTILKYSVILLCSLSVVTLVSCKSKEKVPSFDDGKISTLDGAAVSGIDTQAPMVLGEGGSDTGSISGLVSINFGYDSTNLTEANKQSLQGNANWVKSNPGVTLLVEGHCDQRGSLEYNLALGERRAQTVKNYLISLGVDPAMLTIISYGKEKLVEMGDSDLAQSKNRRANFVPVR